MARYLLTTMFVLGVGCGGGGGSDDDPGTCTLGEPQGCTCTSGGSGTQFCDDAGNFGECGMCGPVDPDPNAVNFRAEIIPIMVRSCGSGSTACHARNQYAATQNMDCRGWLTLEDADLGSEFYSGPNMGNATGCPDLSLHARLMSIDPWECAPGEKYIVPGNPTDSYVMHKLNGSGPNGAPLCSEAGAPSVQMPPSDSLFTLSAADKNLIQQWITEGALDN
jgi:hypothetical protein